MDLLHATDKTFESEVLQSDIPVLVDFFADWCGPCKMIAPIIEDIASEFEGKIKVIKVNVDEASEVAAKYSIMSIPTIILFKNSEVSKQVVGYKSKEALITEFEL